MKSFVSRLTLAALAASTASLCLLASSPARAWGTEGHRITGYIADSMLTPRARLIANQLLDGESLADASNYMDIYREALKREIPGSDRWHFNNRQVCEDAPLVCPDGNCASAQIPRQYAILADTTKSKSERQQALRFLIHLVGDIHQPLHAADDNDLGGNRKAVFMPGANFPRNLHAVWDSDILKVAFRGRSETDVARDLINAHQKKFRGWMRGNVTDWMNESYGLAKRLVYGQIPSFACGELDGKKTGLLDGKLWPEEPQMLKEEYVRGATGVIPVLIAQAGARLGGMLNQALDPREIVIPREPSTATKDTTTPAARDAKSDKAPPKPVPTSEASEKTEAPKKAD